MLRCDAGSKHGLGHLSRCMTLAAAFQTVGIVPRLVVNTPPAIAERLVAAGFLFIHADASVGLDDPAEWISPETALVVIDSKDATAEYVGACRTRCPVVCIDDEVARSLPCDAVINNNPWALAQDYSSDQLLLLGPTYNTVNPAYYLLHGGTRRRGLLISLGGEDPNDRTSWLVKTLAPSIGSLPVHVCIGPAHPDSEAVAAACSSAPFPATIHRSPPTLVQLASICHLAISAGGTTCYELAAAGIPMAILAIEEHQQRLQSAMVQAGAALSLGGEGDLVPAKVHEAMALLREERILVGLAAAGRGMFPAAGAASIVAGLAPLIESHRSSIQSEDC